MAANFPFRTKPEKELIWCYRQCFTVIDYVPSICNQVLQFVIDKCLEMDVEIKIHDGGEVTLDDNDDEDEAIFELELENPSPKASKGDLTVDEMADKVCILKVLHSTFVNFMNEEFSHSLCRFFLIVGRSHVDYI